VTPEAKIRQLCTQLIAAENDEAANMILQELRDGLHEYCERLRRVVAREYPFHKKMTWPQTERVLSAC
jgi:hypothetical protein